MTINNDYVQYPLAQKKTLDEMGFSEEAKTALLHLDVITQTALSNQKRFKTLDQYTNPLANLGFGADNVSNGGMYQLTRLTYNYKQIVAMYRSSWIFQRIINTRARDLYRESIVIDSEIDPTKVKKFLKKIKRINPKLIEGTKWGKLFGGAIGIILLDIGQTLAIDPETKMLVPRMQLPLNLKDIKKDSFKGIVIRDRWYTGVSIGPEKEDNIDSPDYGLPKYYYVTLPGKEERLKVHNSWILRFTGEEMPYVEREADSWWGTSIIETLADPLNKFKGIESSIAELVYRASLRVVKMENYKDYANNPEQEEEIRARLEQLKRATNQGIVGLDTDDEYETVNTSFTNLDAILNEFKLIVTGAGNSTVKKIFGSLGGNLGGDSEGTESVYNDDIKSEQEEKIQPIYDKLLPIIYLSEFGENIPKDFSYDFKYLGDSGDKSTYRSLLKDKLDIIKENFMFGTITKSIALKELKQVGEEYGLFSNITAKYIKEVEELEINSKGYMLEEGQENNRINQYSEVPVVGEDDNKSDTEKKKDKLAIQKDDK